jgi:hypothetical protein
MDVHGDLALIIHGAIRRVISAQAFHKCPTCGNYHSCTTDDGVTVHRKMKCVRACFSVMVLWSYGSVGEGEQHEHHAE